MIFTFGQNFDAITWKILQKFNKKKKKNRSKSRSKRYSIHQTLHVQLARTKQIRRDRDINDFGQADKLNEPQNTRDHLSVLVQLSDESAEGMRALQLVSPGDSPREESRKLHVRSRRPPPAESSLDLADNCRLEKPLVFTRSISLPIVNPTDSIQIYANIYQKWCMRLKYLKRYSGSSFFNGQSQCKKIKRQILTTLVTFIFRLIDANSDYTFCDWHVRTKRVTDNCKIKYGFDNKDRIL